LVGTIWLNNVLDGIMERWSNGVME